MSAALQEGFTVLPAIFNQEEIATLRQARSGAFLDHDGTPFDGW